MNSSEEKAKNAKARPRKWWAKKRWWAVAGMFVTFGIAPYYLRTADNTKYYQNLEPLIGSSENIQNPSKYNPEVQDKLASSSVRELKVEFASEFPDAQSCLLKTERNKGQPNLLAVNWELFNGIRFAEIAEVCLYRIFDAINNQEKVIRWLQIYGYDTEEIGPGSPFFPVKDSPEDIGATKIISAARVIAEAGTSPLFPTRGWWRFRQHMAWRTSIAVHFSNNKILKVKLHSTYK